MRKIYLVPDKYHKEESIALAKEYGAFFEYNDFFAPQILEDKRKQAEIINEYAKFRGDFSNDTIHGAFLDVTVHSQDDKIRQISELRVEQSMELAAQMGVRAVVFHTNRLYGFLDAAYLEHWTDANERFFTKIAERYPKQEIYLENMFDESYEPLLELADRMKPVENFGVCLDYAHCAAFGGKPEEWLEALAPFIRHMHINDNNLKEDLHLPVGKGRIDWQQFKKTLKSCNIEASALIEVNGRDKQKASLEYLRKNDIL